VKEAWSDSAPTGTSFDIEFRIRRHDGVFRWFKTRAVPQRNDAGLITKWFGTNTDIDDHSGSEGAAAPDPEKWRASDCWRRSGT